MPNLFVYGTLKQGFPLNDWLTRPDGTPPSVLKNPDVVVKGFSLINLGNYPAAIAASDQDYLVGELWEVPKERLDKLSRMERGAGFEDRKVICSYTKRPFIYEQLEATIYVLSLDAPVGRSGGSRWEWKQDEKVHVDLEI